MKWLGRDFQHHIPVPIPLSVHFGCVVFHAFPTPDFFSIYASELRGGKFWGVAHDLHALGVELPGGVPWVGPYTARFDRVFYSKVGRRPGLVLQLTMLSARLMHLSWLSINAARSVQNSRLSSVHFSRVRRRWPDFLRTALWVEHVITRRRVRAFVNTAG